MESKMYSSEAQNAAFKQVLTDVGDKNKENFKEAQAAIAAALRSFENAGITKNSEIAVALKQIPGSSTVKAIFGIEPGV